MPPFVVLEHTLADGSQHWDLMLQQGDLLATWQVPLPPEQWGAEPVTCRKIFDHRLKYLDYEGPISENRGQIKRVDVGKYQVVIFSDERVEGTLEGELLSGELALTRKNEDVWQLLYQPNDKHSA